MYEYQTTFMQDFAAIEELGETEIKSLAEKLFQLWKDDIVHLTELVMVINHRSWHWYDVDNNLCSIYTDLYYEYDEKAINYLESKGDEDDLRYFFRTLD